MGSERALVCSPIELHGYGLRPCNFSAGHFVSCLRARTRARLSPIALTACALEPWRKAIFEKHVTAMDSRIGDRTMPERARVIKVTFYGGRSRPDSEDEFAVAVRRVRAHSNRMAPANPTACLPRFWLNQAGAGLMFVSQRPR